MRALLSKTPGGPESLVLGEVANPAAETGEVVIAVKACGVNYPDVLIIKDQYQFKPPRPFAPGGEIAGVVEIVGDEAEGFAPGDRVIAVTGWGGMAEKADVPAKRCVKLPDGMSFEDGAAFLMTYGTAHHALKDRAGLQAGETLLVLGAAGGVGLAAVELGRTMGARVVAACSTQEKAALARERGAAETVVYGSGAVDGRALTEALKAACGPQGAEVVFDGVGGDYAEPALRTTAWNGRYLVIGFPAGIPKPPLNLVLLKGAAVIGVFWGAFVEREPERHAANVAELMRMHAAGAIRPHISARYPLEQGARAICDLQDRKAAGKVVVIVDPS
ncbi:MAG: NADPH:quinone oxidoreductase family protein [Pseudomonadota bacterium]|nr:NADPH:quinone oxidoreductase family protein [Pseudomonadota bacterium]